jgi:hypothetical protein
METKSNTVKHTFLVLPVNFANLIIWSALGMAVLKLLLTIALLIIVLSVTLLRIAHFVSLVILSTYLVPAFLPTFPTV